MQLADVIPFPAPDATRVVSRRSYLIRHEDRVEVDMLEPEGRRVMRIRKTFFDGSDRVEFSLEKEMSAVESVDAVLTELEAAVAAYFDA